MAAETLAPFVTGGLSAMLASATIHPIDLSKVRIQLYATMHPGKPIPGFTTVLSGMIAKEGILGIYAGLSASLLRQAVYGTARIGLHRHFSDKLSKSKGGKPLSMIEKVGSGMASGAIAVTIGTPFDVSLVRMQADGMKVQAERRGYKNVFDALIRVATEEGPKTLWNGLAPNIGRGMAMNVGQLACFDQAKEFFASYIDKEIYLNKNYTPSKSTQGAAACVAAFTATAFSLPFDLMKSRLQDGARFKGLTDCFMSTLRTEGPFAFWTGFGAYYMRTAPHSMIILMAGEPIRRAYNEAFLK
jgi:solute carrier family 25 (mitochondrial oxoglutarate transporter), member 11